jgi:predicted acetyltransferase
MRGAWREQRGTIGEMSAALVAPDVQFESSYREAMAEFAAEGRLEELGSLPKHENFAGFVQELMDWSQGSDLPTGWVPQSSFWLVDGAWFIGKVEVRHRLTDALRLRGGHVGYAIRPTARRRGYGRAALSLVLRPCRDLGLSKILVTCDITNDASRRIIESNGGTLEDVVHVPGRPVGTMRYWIDVAARVGTTDT